MVQASNGSVRALMIDNRKDELFRPEAISSFKLRAYSPPPIANPLPPEFVIFIFAALAATLVCIIGFGRFTPIVRLDGVVAPTEVPLRVVSPSNGRIERWSVNVGDRVHRNDLILALRTTAPSEPSPLRDIKRQAFRDIAHLATLAYQLSELTNNPAWDGYLEVDKPHGAAATSVSSATAADPSMMDRLKWLSDELNEEVATVRSDLNVPTAEEPLAGTIVEIRAPMDGVVIELRGASGNAIEKGASLAALTPLGSTLQVLLFATTPEAARIKQGYTVSLDINAIASSERVRLDGVVSGIVELEQIPPSSGADSSATKNPGRTHAVLVSVPQHEISASRAPGAFRNGSRVEGYVSTAQRRIYRWLLRPLSSALNQG